ncbi:MAG: four helix bundle protein [Clostridia bacterium]|jgi:hypothetical protein|nr:four helix bundle protein [Clostridia bacterium]
MKDTTEYSLQYVDEEIEEELRRWHESELAEQQPPALEEYPENLIKRSARKPFRIPDFDPPRDKEMAVFTHAKKLSEYIFVITEKSPKKLRWSIISRFQNASVDLVEHLYRANFERDQVRESFQKSALVDLCLIDFYAETARRKQAINGRQTAVIARQLAEMRKLLNGWIKSTKAKTT